MAILTFLLSAAAFIVGHMLGKQRKTAGKRPVARTERMLSQVNSEMRNFLNYDGSDQG